MNERAREIGMDRFEGEEGLVGEKGQACTLSGR